jgi:hypothetical protein
MNTNSHQWMRTQLNFHINSNLGKAQPKKREKCLTMAVPAYLKNLPGILVRYDDGNRPYSPVKPTSRFMCQTVRRKVRSQSSVTASQKTRLRMFAEAIDGVRQTKKPSAAHWTADGYLLL